VILRLQPLGGPEKTSKRGGTYYTGDSKRVFLPGDETSPWGFPRFLRGFTMPPSGVFEHLSERGAKTGFLAKG